MKKIKLIIALCCLTIVANAQPPNNPIFYGGSGDGLNNTSYQQTSLNINLGGDGDGWHMSNYIQLADASIFLGGDGDGWHMNNYEQLADAAIFLGGDGDGWHMNNYEQLADAAVFRGGDGDGWASVIYPMGPLPIELLSFDGYQDNTNDILHWKTSSEINSSHFVIEHSTNAQHFLELGMLNAAGNSSVEKTYAFTNHKPVEGNNFYRLKMVDKDGKFKYSNIILLKRISKNTFVNLYPSSAKDIVHVDLGGFQDSKLNVDILGVNGQCVLHKTISSSIQTFDININELASGLYIMLLTSKTEKVSIKFSKQ